MTTLYRGYNQSNILGSQYHIIRLSWSPQISRIVSKVNPFSEEICHTAQGTLKRNAIKHTFAQLLNMLPLYGPHIPKVIFKLLRCSNGKQPDLYL